MGAYGDPQTPTQPPQAWQRILNIIGGVLGVFGKIAFLVDENTQAVHFFMNALLQLIDRAGSLYAELVRFVLRCVRLLRDGILGASACVLCTVRLPDRTLSPVADSWVGDGSQSRRPDMVRQPAKAVSLPSSCRGHGQGSRRAWRVRLHIRE